MTTIHNFERALGRRILWSQAGAEQGYQFVPRLRIYPHALREANAYYSPQKKALLFGYFPASTSRPGAQPPRRHGLHLPVARRRRPRDDARAARRPAPALHRADQPRHPGVPRGVRRHRGAVPALLLRAGAARPDPRAPAATWRARTCSASSRSSSARRIGNRGALRDALGEVDPGTGEWMPQEARSGRPAEGAGAAHPRRHPGGGGLRRLPVDLQVAHRRPAAHRHRRHRRAAAGGAPSRPGRPAGAGGRDLRRATSSPCASARSTTARRWTSPSATTCAPWSPPTATWCRTTTGATASR